MNKIVNKKYVLICILAELSYTAYAQTPDAGSIIRETEQNVPQIPQKLDSDITTVTQAVSSKDTTPIKVDNIVLKGRNLVSQEKLQPLLDAYIGKTTTFGGLQQLSQQISQAYQQAGYPLATVVIPPQRIENGEVVLQILEGAVNTISANNQSLVSNQVVNNYLVAGIPLNLPLQQSVSERALLLIKDLAGTEQVSYQVDGDANGTNLIAYLDPAPKIDGYVNVDNYGSESTGEWRTRVGGNLNSPFGRGERISLEAMSSFKGVDYARLSSDIPVGYDGINLTLGAKHTQYDLGGDFKNLDATGTSDSVDVGIRYPVIRSNHHNLWFTTTGEYRDLQDKVNSTNTITDKIIKALNIGFNGFRQDSWLSGGYTQWNITNTMGNLDIESEDALTIDHRSARTQGDYFKIAGSINRAQYLAPRFSIHSGLQGQWTNKNLDSSEQLSLGGAGAVSAYHSNDVSADLGVIGKLEARYDLNPNVTVGAFYDAGRVKRRVSPYTDEDNYLTLHGGGLSLNTQYKDLVLQSKVAWQGSDEKFDKGDEPKVWVNANYRF